MYYRFNRISLAKLSTFVVKIILFIYLYMYYHAFYIHSLYSIIRPANGASLP